MNTKSDKRLLFEVILAFVILIIGSRCLSIDWSLIFISCGMSIVMLSLIFLIGWLGIKWDEKRKNLM